MSQLRQMRWRGAGLLGLAVTLVFVGTHCGGAPGAPSNAPVMLDAEDEVELDITCSIRHRLERQERASLAQPALARSTRGFVVAWIDREGSRRRVRLLELSSHLAPLGEPLELEPGGDMPLNLSLSSCGGRHYVAWELQERHGSSIQVATVELGASTINGQETVAIAPRGENPALACSDGTAAIVWSSEEGGLRDISLRWLGAGGDLSSTIRVSGETDMASTPAIACSGEHCAVVWSDRRFVYAEIFGSIFEVGNEAGHTPVRVSEHDQTSSGAGGAYWPAVSPLDDRSFLVSWHDNRSRDESEIYASTLSLGGRAGQDRRISRSSATSTRPASTSCAEARGAIAWHDRRSGPLAVFVAAVDDRSRRRSAAALVSENGDEVSAPSASCLEESDYAVAWTEADPETSTTTLSLVLVRCF